MASLINVADLTINSEEAKDIAQLIIEKAFQNGVLSESHTIETGILYNRQIPFAGKITDSLKKATGCTPNVGNAVTFSEKFWTPQIFDSRWIHCAGDLNNLFKLFQKASRINPDFYDRIGSQELGLIVALIEQMLTDVMPVKLWFSDTAADDIAGGGSFKNGTDLDLYNVIDGLFKQIFAEINAGKPNYIELTENAGATYAAQVLGVDAGVAYLGQAYDKADSRLIDDPSAMFYVTRSIADNYRKTLRTKTLGAGFIEVTENGRPELYFEGYKLKVRSDWDRDIKKLFDNGTKVNKPHRLLFTTPENIPVGTLSVDDFDTLDSFYDRTLKSNIVDVAFSLDVKFLESYMAVAAY
jgi:hypothetical protein